MPIFAPPSEIVGDQSWLSHSFNIIIWDSLLLSLYPRTLLNVLPVDCNVIVAIRAGLFMIESQSMT